MEFIESLTLLHIQQHFHNALPLLDNNSVSSFSTVQHSTYCLHSQYSEGLSPQHFHSSDEVNSTDIRQRDQRWVTLPHNSTTTTVATAIHQESVVNDELLFPLRLPVWGIVILILGYALIFIAGVIGNCFVLLVITQRRKMKTATNFFIVALSVADLLVLLVCLLPNLISNIFVPWVLGWFLCKTVPYIQGVSVCASVYFLVAISVERCITVQWPFKYQITKSKAKRVILGIWLWSMVVALPWSIFFQSGAFDPDNPQLEFCIEVWPEEYQEWSVYYFLLGNLVICYILPLGIILVCYLTIWFRVYRRPVPSDCYHKAMELIYQRSKTAVIKMLIVVVTLFALSWLPLYAIIILVKFGPEPSEAEMTAISFFYPIAQWLGCSNSCINPIIYSFLNKKFRKAFLSVIWKERRRITIKHKSPTVNILLKRFSSYRVETTVSHSNDYGSCDSI